MTGTANMCIAYVEFDVPMRTADRIAQFYREVMGARTDAGRGPRQSIRARRSGIGQHFNDAWIRGMPQE